MIRGRRPGAPSVTPVTGPVSRHGGHGQEADLSAIRRSDAIIDMVASRRRLRPRALRDPAVAVLSSLVADVNAASCRPRPAAGCPAGARARLVAARSRPAGAHSRPAAARPRGSAAAAAAAAIATAVAVVAAAGLVVVVMLTRMAGARGWDRYRGR